MLPACAYYSDYSIPDIGTARRTAASSLFYVRSLNESTGHRNQLSMDDVQGLCASVQVHRRDTELVETVLECLALVVEFTGKVPGTPLTCRELRTTVADFVYMVLKRLFMAGGGGDGGDGGSVLTHVTILRALRCVRHLVRMEATGLQDAIAFPLLRFLPVVAAVLGSPASSDVRVLRCCIAILQWLTTGEATAKVICHVLPVVEVAVGVAVAVTTAAPPTKAFAALVNHVALYSQDPAVYRDMQGAMVALLPKAHKASIVCEVATFVHESAARGVGCSSVVEPLVGAASVFRDDPTTVLRCLEACLQLAKTPDGAAAVAHHAVTVFGLCARNAAEIDIGIGAAAAQLASTLAL
jgi:hypothetical protein